MKNNLEKFLQKIIEDKKKEAEKIIENARKEARKLRAEIEKEAEEFYKNWFDKEKKRLLRIKQEKIFEAKMNARKKLLEVKQSIVKNAFDKVLQFLKENPQFLPQKEIITREGVKKIKLSPEEYLDILSKELHSEIEKVFEDES